MDTREQDVASGSGGATGGGGGPAYTPDELKKAGEWLADRKQSPFTQAQRKQLALIAGLNRVDHGEYIKMAEGYFRKSIPLNGSVELFCQVSREALGNAPAPPADMKQALRPSSRAGSKSHFDKLTGMVNDWGILIEKFESKELSKCSKLEIEGFQHEIAAHQRALGPMWTNKDVLREVRET